MADENEPMVFATRCSPSRIQRLMADEPTDREVEALKRLGFYGISTVKIKTIGNEFMKWILDIYDRDTKSFAIGEGMIMKVTEEDVKNVYGLPQGGKEVDVDIFPVSLRQSEAVKLMWTYSELVHIS